MDDKIKILHRRAHGFNSVYSTGAISSIEPQGGNFMLTFYEDVVGINHETLVKIEGTKYRTEFEEGALESHREDKVRVTMGPQAVRNLINLLQDQLALIEVSDDITAKH